MRTPKSKDIMKSKAMKFLDDLIGEPITFGSMLETIRETDGYSLATISKKLGVTRGHVCDVEKGRRGVSAERAMKWAKALGYSPTLFVKHALQDELDRAGILLEVDVRDPKKRKAA
jgi:antitoxin HigA-1